MALDLWQVPLILFCSIILLFAASAAYTRARDWRGMVPAQGKVTRVESRREGYRELAYPWISFSTPDGAQVEFSDVRAMGAAPGDEVTVYYNPASPRFSATVSDKNHFRGLVPVLAVFGLLLAVLAGLLLALR